MAAVERIKQDISDSQENPKVLIFISGNWPGSGASTQAKEIARILNIPRVAGGDIRRAVSLAADEYLKLPVLNVHTGELYTQEEKWHIFRKRWLNFFQEGPEKLLRELKPYLDLDRDEEALKKFTRDQKKYSPHDLFWDQIPELVAVPLLLEARGPAVVYEAKIATILPELVKDFPTQGVTIINLLLEVTEEVSAWRVTRSGIEAGTIPYSGVSKEDLLAWWDDHAKIPPNVVIEDLLTWENLVLALAQRNNVARIEGNQDVVGDLDRYAESYNKPREIFTWEHKKAQVPPENVFDANGKQEDITAALLHAIIQAAPHLKTRI
jgi:hypothetical protein